MLLPAQMRLRRGGVLKNTFAAPLRAMQTGAVKMPDAWSKIIGTPICMGENDLHSDCLPTMAVNAALNAAARNGIFVPVADTVPFGIYQQLGGMPADVGLNPATLFNYWQQNAIAGYRAGSIEALRLNDVEGMKSAIIDTGFLCCTAALTEAQMNQRAWAPVPNSPAAGNHAFCAAWFEGPYLFDDTWGEEIPMTWDFIAAQGIDVWRIELVAA